MDSTDGQSTLEGATTLSEQSANETRFGEHTTLGVEPQTTSDVSFYVYSEDGTIVPDLNATLSGETDSGNEITDLPLDTRDDGFEYYYESLPDGDWTIRVEDDAVGTVWGQWSFTHEGEPHQFELERLGPIINDVSYPDAVDGVYERDSMLYVDVEVENHWSESTDIEVTGEIGDDTDESTSWVGSDDTAITTLALNPDDVSGEEWLEYEVDADAAGGEMTYRLEDTVEFNEPPETTAMSPDESVELEEFESETFQAGAVDEIGNLEEVEWRIDDWYEETDDVSGESEESFFEYDNWFEGTYTVEAQAYDELGDTSDEIASWDVEVTPQTEPVSVSLTDENGLSVSNADVMLYNGEERQTTTDGSGTATFDEIEHGEYTIEAHDGDYFLGNERDIDIDSSQTHVDLARSTPWIVDTETEDGVEGDVLELGVDVEHDEEYDVDVVAELEIDGPDSRTVTIQDAVGSGSGEVVTTQETFDEPGEYCIEEITLESDYGSMVTTDSTAAGDCFEVDHEQGDLDVTLRDGDGERLDGGELVLYEIDESGDWHEVSTAETDSDGTVDWEGLDVGEYQVDATSESDEYLGGTNTEVAHDETTEETLERSTPRVVETETEDAVEGDGTWLQADVQHGEGYDVDIDAEFEVSGPNDRTVSTTAEVEPDETVPVSTFRSFDEPGEYCLEAVRLDADYGDFTRTDDYETADCFEIEADLSDELQVEPVEVNGNEREGEFFRYGSETAITEMVFEITDEDGDPVDIDEFTITMTDPFEYAEPLERSEDDRYEAEGVFTASTQVPQFEISDPDSETKTTVSVPAVDENDELDRPIEGWQPTGEVYEVEVDGTSYHVLEMHDTDFETAWFPVETDGTPVTDPEVRTRAAMTGYVANVEAESGDSMQEFHGEELPEQIDEIETAADRGELLITVRDSLAEVSGRLTASYVGGGTGFEDAAVREVGGDVAEDVAVTTLKNAIDNEVVTTSDLQSDPAGSLETMLRHSSRAELSAAQQDSEDAAAVLEDRDQSEPWTDDEAEEYWTNANQSITDGYFYMTLRGNMLPDSDAVSQLTDVSMAFAEGATGVPVDDFVTYAKGGDLGYISDTIEDTAEIRHHQTEQEAEFGRNAGMVAENATDQYDDGTQFLAAPTEDPDLDADIEFVEQPDGEYGDTDDVNATVELTNEGDGTHRFYVEYEARTVESDERFNNYGETATRVTLAPGESAEVPLSWAIESDAPTDEQYVVEASVWDDSTGLADSEQFDEVTADPFVVGEASALEVTDVSAVGDEIDTDDPHPFRVEVTNDGPTEGSEAVSLATGGETVDETGVTLASGEEEVVYLWHAFDEAGEHDVTATNATTTVDVEEPDAAPFFTTSVSGPDEVEVDELIELEARVVNTGDQSATQSLTLIANDETVDTKSLTLDPDDEETVSLEFRPDENDKDGLPLTVQTENASVDHRVDVVAEDAAANLTVTPETDAISTSVDEDVVVPVTIGNIGEESATDEIELRDDDRTLDTASVDLSPGDADSLELTWNADETATGEHQLVVESPNETATITASITEPETEAVAQTYGYGPTNLGYAENTTGLPDDATVAPHWTAETDGAPSGSTAIVGETVYATTDGGAITAIDRDTGDQLWNVTPDAAIIGDTTPTVVDGTVYVAAQDRLYAFDAGNGTHQWNVPVEGTPTTPTVDDGTIYIGTETDDGGAMYALEAATGDTVWDGEFDASFTGAPAVDDGMVYAPGTEVYALDTEDGSAVWSHELTLANGGGVAVDDGTVFIRAENDDAGDHYGRVSAHDAATGDELWATNTDPYAHGGPTVVNDVVVVGTQGDRVVALNRQSGSEQWDYDDADNIFSSPTAVDETVYAQFSDRVVALDAADGENHWTYSHEESLTGSPVVVDETVYIGSDDGGLLALGDDDEAELSVSISDVDEPVAGETATVEFDVTNHGSQDQDQPVTVTLGSLDETTEPVALDPGESTTENVTLSTSENDAGSHDVVVSTAADEDETSIDVTESEDDPKPASLSLSDLETPETVSAGDEIATTITATNEGELEDNWTITLEASELEGTPTNETTIGLEGNESKTIDLTIPTEADHAETTTDLEVHADDEHTTQSVTIDDPEPPSFAVDLVEVPGSVDAGETFTVTAAVSNDGTLGANQSLALIADNETVATENVSLEAGEEAEHEFTVDADPDGADDLTVAIASDDDTAENTVEIIVDDENGPILPPPEDGESPVFDVHLEAPDEATPGDTLEIAVTIENRGEEPQTETVAVVIDGAQSEIEATLEPGETTTEWFSIDVDDQRADSLTVETESGVDTESAVVAIDAEETESEPDETDSETDETDSDDSDSSKADDEDDAVAFEMPGFGAGAAVTALLVALLFARRRA